MICIACKELCLPQPDCLVEKCVHCGEHVCADKHVARYVDRQPVCNICTEWVCDECLRYVEGITATPEWQGGQVVGHRRLCHACGPKLRVIRGGRRKRERQAEADAEEAFQQRLGGPDAA